MSASQEHAERMLTGVAASSGIARGRAFVCSCGERIEAPRHSIKENDAPKELERLSAAVAEVERELAVIRDATRLRLGDPSGAIFDAQLFVLRDPALLDAATRRCLLEKINIEAALTDTAEALGRDFSNIDDALIRERAADLRDVTRRLLNRLLRLGEPGTPAIPPGSIVVTRELLPSLAAALDKVSICGIIAEQGGLTAHAVILARALDIPTLLHVESATEKITTGDLLIVDGLAGRAFIHPSEVVQREYEGHQVALESHRSFLRETLDLPATTRDGTTIKLCANIGKVADASAAAALHADGVGLYRTEFVFFVADHFPSEEEQYQIYLKSAQCIGEREMVIRVLDVGSDKLLTYFPLPSEPNPSLGQRGVRLLLNHPEILTPQLRAILRLSASHPVAVLFPMIGGVDEIVAAKGHLDRVKAELLAEHVPFDPRLRVGAMIETPSAVVTARYIAQEVDFLSVGTNDLTQYLLASDRTSCEMARYYEPLHPAVILSLKAVIDAAAIEGKDVSICGEMAGNPTYVELLLGLGLRSLSVIPGEILEIKRVIRSLTIRGAEDLAACALSARRIGEVKECLATFARGGSSAGAAQKRIADANAFLLRRAINRWENEGGHAAPSPLALP